jgi:hypothetical protein
MAWYEISLDELYHNENMKQEKVTEPRQNANKLSELMISKVLNQLGVDTEDELIHEQQRLLGVDVKEMDSQQLQLLCLQMKKTFNPKALGYYVYQHDEPVAFISDPYVKHNKVTVSIEPYDTRIKFDEKEFQIRGSL